MPGGAHRVEAAKKIEGKEIAAKVLPGDRRTAVLHAVEANRTHGLPMTLEDKKHAARLLLEDPTWSTWSSREIGRRCGLDGKTIEKLRKEVSAENTQMRKCARKNQEYSITTARQDAFPADYRLAFSVIVAAPPGQRWAKKQSGTCRSASSRLGAPSCSCGSTTNTWQMLSPRSRGGLRLSGHADLD